MGCIIQEVFPEVDGEVVTKVVLVDNGERLTVVKSDPAGGGVGGATGHEVCAAEVLTDEAPDAGFADFGVTEPYDNFSVEAFGVLIGLGHQVHAEGIGSQHMGLRFEGISRCLAPLTFHGLQVGRPKKVFRSLEAGGLPESGDALEVKTACFRAALQAKLASLKGVATNDSALKVDEGAFQHTFGRGIGEGGWLKEGPAPVAGLGFSGHGKLRGFETQP